MERMRTHETADGMGATPAGDTELEALRRLGQHWSAGVRPATLGDISPELTTREVKSGDHHGGQCVRIGRRARADFRQLGGGVIQATAKAPRTRGGVGHAFTGLRELLIGDPLSTAQAAHERLTKVKALAVLSSDALSSVAYATGQMATVLILAGTAALGNSLGIMVAIALLLAIVGLSYRQTIKAYPRGGGSYIVSRDNLGDFAGLAAGSSLMIDYVLTVAVSMTAGVNALQGLVPALIPHTVALSLVVVAVLLLGNLRGIRESGSIFALPTSRCLRICPSLACTP